MNGGKVIGIVKGTTKERKTPYTVLHIIGEFPEYQRNNSVGNTANNIYISGDVKCNVGDIVEFVYGVGYQGKAVIKNVVILQTSES